MRLAIRGGRVTVLTNGWPVDQRDCERFVANLAARFEDLGEPWAITGSFGLHLQGLPLNPADVDVVTTRLGATKIGELLRDETLHPVRYSSSDRIRSDFGRFLVEGRVVEVMGDAEVNDDGWWAPAVSWPTEVERRRIGMADIPITTLEHGLRTATAMGDQGRIRAIGDLMREHQRLHHSGPRNSTALRPRRSGEHMISIAESNENHTGRGSRS